MGEEAEIKEIRGYCSPCSGCCPTVSLVMDGKFVGYLSSGMYGHTVGAAIGMGYVEVPDLNAERIGQASFEIEVAKERFSTQASLRPFYDPSSSRMKI